jgi:cyclomaltodextrinase / maltogenic alpha-amylase / neopullulanase
VDLSSAGSQNHLIIMKISLNTGRMATALVSLWLALGPCGAAAAETPNSSLQKSPDWLRKSVVYEIFPRNFSQAGDFNAITAQLDELKDLGVDILWLMPVHPHGQKMKKGSLGSPYAVRDYYAINSEYGSTNDFKRLIAGAHSRGMKVMMDFVAGHTSWDSVLMDRPQFYKKDESGKVIPPNPDWTDVAGLDYTNQDLRRYMMDVLKYWVREFEVDGFRCDVAFTVPTEFWENAHAELEAIHPEIIMLADANAAPKLLAKAFNMDYSGALYLAQNRVLSGLSPATFLRQSWENTRKQFPIGALHVRFSDKHETVRAVARFGVPGALAAQVLVLTLDGVPLFYNGMEVGDATESADPALFEKLPVFWNPNGRPPLREIYRSLIKLRKAHPAFYNDNVVWLQNTLPADVVTFQRADDRDEFVICINLSSRMVSGSVTLPHAESFQSLKIDGAPLVPTSTLPDFQLDGYGWRIYHRSLKE